MTKHRKRYLDTEVFLLLVRQPLTMKELLSKLYPEKMVRKNIYFIECSHCKFRNTKPQESFQKFLDALKLGSLMNIPDYRCTKCRRRLLKFENDKFTTKYWQGIDLDLSESFLRSKSGNIKRKEIDLLLSLKLIKRNKKKYSVDYAGLYTQIFFGFLKILGPITIDTMCRKLAKTKVNDLFREYLLIRNLGDEKLSYVMKDLSDSFGSIWPSELNSLKKYGYTKILTDKQFELFCKYHEQFHQHFLEESGNLNDITLKDLIASRLNRKKARVIIKNYDEIMREDMDRTLLNELPLDRF